MCEDKVKAWWWAQLCTREVKLISHRAATVRHSESQDSWWPRPCFELLLLVFFFSCLFSAQFEELCSRLHKLFCCPPTSFSSFHPRFMISSTKAQWTEVDQFLYTHGWIGIKCSLLWLEETGSTSPVSNTYRGSGLHGDLSCSQAHDALITRRQTVCWNQSSGFTPVGLFLSSTMLVPGWTSFCLQNWFKKVLKTFLRDLGPYWHWWATVAADLSTECPGCEWFVPPHPKGAGSDRDLGRSD